MQIVDQFYQVPGRCYFTGSSSVAKPILDTGHFEEGVGRVYIGGEYLEEACRLLGWHPPEEVDMLVADNVSLRAQVDVLTTNIESRAAIEDDILAAAAKIKPKQAQAASAATPTPFSQG